MARGERPLTSAHGDNPASDAARRSELPDASARAFAIDPAQNVVLEASAGTGKTSVLVARYLNLVRAGVNPANILAMTFTRQAAAEMRARIIHQLRLEAGQSAAGQARWNELRERLHEVTISTVDAFCLSLLREFPLEADLEPGFAMADDTEVPRLMDDAVDKALVLGAALAARRPGVAMLLAQLGTQRTRRALTALLRRRLVVPGALVRFLAGTPRALTGEQACRDCITRLVDRLASVHAEISILTSGESLRDPGAAMVARDLRRLPELRFADGATIRGSLERLRAVFLMRQGTERSVKAPPALAGPERRRYRAAAAKVAPLVADALRALDRDVNTILVRSVRQLFRIAVSQYRHALDSRGLLDFDDVLQRAVGLLRAMDEFAQSRYRLESRYHHVLVDEFQDTSRAQWELVSLLVRSWGEGSGLVHDAPIPPSIFIVGDRKQSIYRFRDADVSVLEDAAREIRGLRGGGDVRRSISQSFRAVPTLLTFINDLFSEVARTRDHADAFRFESRDRFPVPPETEGTQTHDPDPPLGLVAADDLETCAERVATEVLRLLAHGEVRSPDGTGHRAVRPGDIAILFRTRESHREFQQALDRRSVPTYAYKGLGFFDADEIKDMRALIRFLADPWSELRAAALLRSRVARLSDPGLLGLAGRLSEILHTTSAVTEGLDESDRRVLDRLRLSLGEWRPLVDRLPPAELLDRVLDESAYASELTGAHQTQARENLKKLRGLIRRFQNRGYATMARVADHIDHLSHDMSNAVIEAFDAVNLMTVHAAKGLEFPVVFVVDLGRGTGAQTAPVHVVPNRGDGRPSVSVWPYRTEADTEEHRRDLEETKRLFYVATTRARDRLYLSTVLDHGHVRFGRGSFGEIVPRDCATLLEPAAGLPSGRHAHWRTTRHVHVFRVCGDVDRASDVESAGTSDAVRGRLALTSPALPPDTIRRVATGGSTCEPRPADSWEEGLHLTVRTLLCRLVRQNLGRQPTRGELTRTVTAWVERADADQQSVHPESLIQQTVACYTRLAAYADLPALTRADCLFDVPFSLIDRGDHERNAQAVVQRGVIDCLVRQPDGRIIAFDFVPPEGEPEGTGRLDLCVTAVRAMFPGVAVDGHQVGP